MGVVYQNCSFKKHRLFLRLLANKLQSAMWQKNITNCDLYRVVGCSEQPEANTRAVKGNDGDVKLNYALRSVGYG